MEKLIVTEEFYIDPRLQEEIEQQLLELSGGVPSLRDELGLPAGGRDSDGMPGTLQCVSGCVCIYDDCGGG